MFYLVDLCLEVCGDKPGVVCDVDRTKQGGILCTCSDKARIFDQEIKECKIKEGTKI